MAWETVYDLLDEGGEPVLQETQAWTLHESDSALVLDLVWSGQALTDVTIGEYDYGGLFLRMPWTPGMEGQATNAARQRNHFAEGKRAMWMDVGLMLPGQTLPTHVAIFDHPENADFPQPWRVDGQLGVGPVRARLGDWTIANGATETIRHRLLVYTGRLDDVTMRERWETYAGLEGAMYSTASLWGVAQQEAREAEFLSPIDAANQMTLKSGYQVNAWAGEPLLTQPMAFAWDDRGRLWVAENRDYESRDRGFSGSGDSRIVILEDSDRDGTADTRTVFLEGIAFPSALAVGFDGVFVGAPPHLLFIPDRDRNDQADTDAIEIRLTGWGIRDRHETINSFHWGPDGWLYGLEGFATHSVICKPGPEARLYRGGDAFPENLLESDGVPINGGVWRYHPTEDRFEVVAHGFSNPWGIDYDAHGELFISACVIPHVFHVTPGGVYARQGGSHYNPHIYEDIDPIVDHRHRSAHGGARIYQSDAFSPEERGRLFMANIHEHAVLSDILEPTASGFIARHGDEFMMAHNAQWVGFSLEIGPEGALYVLDWHDADICGGDVLDKDTGRIFRITPESTQADQFEGRYDDLYSFTDLDLAKLQHSPSDWHARRARVLLQQRASERLLDELAVTHLESLLNPANPIGLRLKALWSLHVARQLSTDALVEALDDDSPYLRAWAVRLLTDASRIPAGTAEHLVELAHEDRSPVVRKFIAAALQRLDPDRRWPIIAELVQHADDASDPNIPVLIWLGLEPMVMGDPERALALAQASQMPKITEFVARRLTAGARMDVLLGELHDPVLLSGMLAGLEGMHDVRPPEGWGQVYRRIRNRRATRDLARSVAQVFGDAEAERELVNEVLDESQPVARRRDALRAVASRQPEALRTALPELWNQPAIQLESIRAVAAYADQELGERLLALYPALDAQARQAAIGALASRPVYGWMLVEALKEGNLDRRDIPPWIARQMRRVVGSGFVEIWGPVDEGAGDREVRYAQVRALVESDRVADLKNGEAVYARACGLCHQLSGSGGAVGPDLTGSNRTSVDYLLSNLIYPDESIQDDYRMVIVTTRDGRTYVGTLMSESDRSITVRPVGLSDVVLARSEVQSMEVSDKSLMPEGLLDSLTEEEVVNLFAFLRTASVQ